MGKGRCCACAAGRGLAVPLPRRPARRRGQPLDRRRGAAARDAPARRHRRDAARGHDHIVGAQAGFLNRFVPAEVCKHPTRFPGPGFRWGDERGCRKGRSQTSRSGIDMSDVKIARALLSVSDKTGLVELGQALARHGVELVSTGGTAKALARCGARGARRLGPHRLSRDDGRAGEDAPSQGPWRPARRPRRPRSCRRHGRTWDRRDRSGGRQPLSLRPDGGEGRGPGRNHREYRYRRPVDGPLGGQEPCVRRVSHRSGRLCRADRSLGCERRHDVAGFPQALGREGVCRDRGL